MPKKKNIIYEKPILERPHRNMKAKVVFDPSDNYIPKKRRKHSNTNKESIEETTVKKITYDRGKQKGKTKARGPAVNPVTEVSELFNHLSTEINTMSSIHSPIIFEEKTVTPKVTLARSKNCFICSKILGKTEIVDCPICLIKVHKHCLIVSEPMWKFKLDFSPWFCKKCRKQNCNKCLKDESESEILRRCITCEVGLHISCYESYDIKPLQKLETNMYVCIPCMTLATQINPEEEDIIEAVKVENDDDVKSRSASIILRSSDEDDTDSESNKSNSSSEYEKYYDEFQSNNVPNISNWTSQQVFQYLTEKLPTEIINQIMKYNFNGNDLLSLERSYITSKMGMKLGHALAFYKQVQILQSQCTFSHITWK